MDTSAFSRDTIFSKIIGIFGSCLVVICSLSILITPPAQGYEISVYQFIPWYYWATLFILFVTTITYIFRKSQSSGLHNIIIFILFCGLITVIFIPYIRGYYIYGRADVLSHIGYIRSITHTGGVLDRDHYPILHILSASIKYTTGTSLQHLSLFVPQIFFIVYIASILALLKEFIRDEARKIAISLAILPLYGSTQLQLIPYGLSTLFVPIVLYAAIRFYQNRTAGTHRNLILLVIFLSTLILFHPATSLITLVIIFSYVLYDNKELAPDLEGIIPILLSAVIFIWWQTSFLEIIQYLLAPLDLIFQSNQGGTRAEKYGSIIDQASPEVLDLMIVGLFRSIYSQSAILFATYILFSYIYFKKIGFKDLRYNFVFGISLIFVLFSVFSFIFHIPVSAPRFLQYVMLFSIIGISYFYTTIDNYRNKWAYLFLNIMTIVIIILVLVSLFGLFGSSGSKVANAQFTESEMEGMTWLFENSNKNTPVKDLGIRQIRPYEAKYGRHVPTDNIRHWQQEDSKVPSRLGYENGTYLGNQTNEDYYMTITTLGRIRTFEFFSGYEESWSYYPQDFNRLENDPSVSKIFSSDDIDHYYIDSNG